MAYDKKAYGEWEKQFPNATDEEKQHVKDMYVTDKDEDDKEVVLKQGATQLDPPKAK